LAGLRVAVANLPNEALASLLQQQALFTKEALRVRGGSLGALFVLDPATEVVRERLELTEPLRRGPWDVGQIKQQIDRDPSGREEKEEDVEHCDLGGC